MNRGACWFSDNPEKAWAEKFFLIYSPIWMLQMAVVMLFGIDESLGDVGYVVQACLVALPFVIVPAVLRRAEPAGRDWWRTYWWKANVYMAVFGFFGNYFGTEYFFDVLGMVYDYPRIGWNFDATLVGSGEQKVPIIMYLLTHAYFMTYHTSAVVVLRRIRTSGLPGVSALFWVMVFVVGYCWAWIETKAMANPLIAENFYYRKMDMMLAYGSVFYSLYFIGSFPVFYFLDEDRNHPWSVRTTVLAALAVSMIVFYLLDFWTKFIGAL